MHSAILHNQYPKLRCTWAGQIWPPIIAPQVLQQDVCMCLLLTAPNVFVH